MILSYTLPQSALVIVTPVDPTVLGGEDIALLATTSPNSETPPTRPTLDVTPAGKWATVSGPQAGRQSVLREMGANPGDFVRRPAWGFGARGLLFKGATPSVRDQMISRAKARLAVNPRVKKTIEVSGAIPPTGVQLTVRCLTSDGRLDLANQVITP